MLGPQGRRGEVLAELHTDYPERFAERRRLYGLDRNGTRRPMEVEEHWFHKGGVVLKFVDVDSISQAEAIAGLELQVRREERTGLEAGSAYISDVVGCEVWTISGGKKQLLGSIAEVQFGAGEAPLLLVRSAQKEMLIPYAAEFLRSADFERRRIEMDLPEGLLDVDAPLTVEEREQQKLEAGEARAAGEQRRRK